MLEIASILIYLEFDDIKECDIAKYMWNKLVKIHGGDNNLLRAKLENLRGNFDDMRMLEGENIMLEESRNL